jgi:Integrase core domain
VWSPGEHLVIDWGSLAGLHVFCAVLAWSRFRFVRFAADERAETTLAMLAECFEVLGGVPGKVLADRMGCLKGGVVANVVVPAGQYVRFAAHYGFRPDFCEAADPESKGIVENLVGYAKRDLMVPQSPFGDLAAANEVARAWCAEVNGAVHSEICAVPAERLVIERELLAGLPSLRAATGRLAIRKVDRLSCVRFASGPLLGARRPDRRRGAAAHRRRAAAGHHDLGRAGRRRALPGRARRGIGPRRALRRAAAGAPAGGAAQDRGGEGVLRPRPGRRGVHHRRRRGRLHPAARRAGRAEHAARRPRRGGVRRRRSILAAGAGLPAKAAPGGALVLELPAVPVRPLPTTRSGSCHDRAAAAGTRPGRRAAPPQARRDAPARPPSCS